MAMALVLGMAQCKKQETPATPEANGETVHITMKVDGGDKHTVYPSTGAVVYGNGDLIYVGNNGHYVGTLTYANGAFSGDITSPSTADYLHFYFLGGLTITPTAATTSYTVSIANQSSKLPVLSYGQSTQKYTDGNATYSCTLMNKCALVKFDLVVGKSDAVTVAGMLTNATIDFAMPSITPAQTTGGITLYSESETAKWAILLPQNAVDDAAVTIGSDNFTVDVPALAVNDFVTSDVVINNKTYAFSVGANTVVHFAPGNLQYKSGTGWRFAEHQYDCIGAWNTADWVDLFGWGTWTGTNPNPLRVEYGSSTWSSYTWSSDDFRGTIMNNSETGWRTPTGEEWEYVLFTRITTSGIRYAKASVSGVNGVILLPDDWTISTYTLNNYNTHNVNFTVNQISANDWTNTLEANGAVFLPAAGAREGTNIGAVNTVGQYWSATYSSNTSARMLFFDDSRVNGTTYTQTRDMGLSVRLVR